MRRPGEPVEADACAVSHSSVALTLVLAIAGTGCAGKPQPPHATQAARAAEPPPPLPAGAPPVVTASTTPTITVVERAMQNQNPVFSADGLHVLVRVGDGHPANELSLDGQRVTPVEPAGGAVLASDGSWVAYIARTPDGHYALVHRGARVPLDHDGTLAVSPSGAHWAVALYDSSTGRDRVLLDGTQVFVGHTPSELAVADTGRLVFSALTDPMKSSQRVYSGSAPGSFTPGPVIDGIGDLQISADGTHVIHVAMTGRTTSVVIDGKRGASYRFVTGAVELAGGRPLYVARRAAAVGADAEVVVAQGRELGPYRAVLARAREGVHAAWAAETTSGSEITLHVVLDGSDLWHQSLGARSPLDDRAPAVAGLAVHPVGHEVAVGLTAATGWPRLVVIAAGQALATELAGEPLRYDSTGDIIALVAPAADPARRLVRSTRRPFASGVDGPPIDELYADTLRFDAAGATLTYFALVDGNLVFVRQPTR